MADTSLRQCPRCELRFVRLAELDDHLDRDHGLSLARADRTRLVVDVDSPEEASATRGVLVVPLDPSREPGPAVVAAGALAGALGLAVEVVAVRPRWLPVSAVEAYLGRRAAEARAAGAPAATARVLPAGDIATALVDRLGWPGTTLACMASRSRGLFGELVLGSVSEAVLRAAPVPVVVLGPHARDAAGPVRRVVAGLDGSPLAEQALAVADGLASRLGATLELVEAVDGPALAGVDTVERYLRAQAGRCRTGDVVVDAEADHDPAHALLAHVAGDPTAMVAVGTVGASGLRRVAVGSVALDVVRDAPGPVLVVPTTVAPSPGAGRVLAVAGA